MRYELDEAVAVLERTPATLTAMLTGLPDAWITATEGPETWSPYDVLGHLVHGEQTDWIARPQIIMSEEGDKLFAPFDRFAQFHESTGKSMDDLLLEFKELRERNLRALRQYGINETNLSRTGIHPRFGEVTLRQLLSTWVAHDLGHIGQIARVMAKQYKEEAGPWVEYLRILKG